MQKIKTLAKHLLARRKVRKILLILHVPIAWVIVRANGLFDDEWYRLQYGGHRHEAFKNRTPLLHYLYIGRQIGLAPSPFFIPEYYDYRRWNHAIIDPLVKYCVYRSNRSAPTSPLFDGKRFESHSRFKPPLSAFMRVLRDDSGAHLVTTQLSEKSWNELKPAIHKHVQERRDQYEERKASEPIAQFDNERSVRAIEKYKTYFRAESEQPLVSIIMPAWNREDLIVAAIESVNAQTYQNWELLVVDDGSTDKTVDVVLALSAKDERIQLFTPGHGGVCKARNHGIGRAKGGWIAFLDSDNTWTPNFLMTTIGSLEESKSKVGYAAIKMNSGNSIRYRATEPNPKLLETGNHVDLNALVVERQTLDEVGAFDERLRRMVDYDLVIRLSKAEPFIYIPIVGVEYTDHEDLARITTTESLSWDGVVKNENFIDWKALELDKKPNGVNVVVPVKDSLHSAVVCVTQILATTGDEVKIIIADAASNSATNITMASLASLHAGRIEYYRFSATHDVVLAANYGFAKSTADKIVFVNQHVFVEDDWLSQLVAGIDSKSIAGPLQLQPGRTVRSAGVEFHGPNTLPVNVLADHPLSDTTTLAYIYEVDGLMNGCFGIESGLFAKLHGLNPLYDKGFELQDLSHRVHQIGAKTVIVKHSRVINPDSGRGWYRAGQKQYLADWGGITEGHTSPVWRQAGFDVVDYEPIHSEQADKSMLRPRLEVVDKILGQYRWAIKVSSPADERRHVWGDTHYAGALAKALERQGQRVAIDYHDYHDRPTSYLDDILLDLRGLDDTQPQPGKLNIMWVISHPEKVTPEIVKRFDVVFAAGKKWADYMSEHSGKEVMYLPQCTDPEVFHPTEPDPQFAGKVLFAGSSRNVLRPIVRDAIATGIDVNVYGGGWEGLIDKKYIKGAFIPNNRLTYAYSSASVVLNDHWDDMREWGFISNRIFDVLATGTPVVSDGVYGVSETVTSPLLAVYDDDLVEVCNMLESRSSNSKEAAATVEYIRENHSFDSRADLLLSKVEVSLSSKD